MRKLLASLSLLAFLSCAGSAAQAQNVPNGGAVNVPIPASASGTPVGTGGTFTSGDLVVGGSGSTQVQDATAVFTGTSRAVLNSFAPNVGSDLALGTVASPLTTAGPNLKLSRTEQIASSSCGSNQVANECNATLVLESFATATDGMQNAALFAGASGASTTAGTTPVGALLVGRLTGSGVGIGTGAYIEGRSDTATGNFIGTEIRANNQTGSSYTYSTSAFSSGALWVTAQSSVAANLAGHGIALGSVSSAQFDVGYAATAGSVKTTTFQDDSSSATSLQINGSHATAQIAGTGFKIDSSGSFVITATTATCPASTTQIFGSAANTISFCTNGNNIAQVTTSGVTANKFTVTAANNPVNGMNLAAANTVAFFNNSTESFRITGSQAIQYTAVVTGTPAASLCIDASNNIIKKTTTGSCI